MRSGGRKQCGTQCRSSNVRSKWFQCVMLAFALVDLCPILSFCICVGALKSPVSDRTPWDAAALWARLPTGVIVIFFNGLPAVLPCFD